MRNRNVFLRSMLILSLITGVADAYQLEYVDGEPRKWQRHTLTFHVDARTIAQDSPWWTALAEAVTRFNDNPSNFQVEITPATEPVWFDNGRSEIWLNQFEDRTAPAFTLKQPWPDSEGNLPHAEIIEADIIIKPEVLPPWSASELKSRYGGSRFNGYGGEHQSLVASLLHEMGHAAGLKHENRKYSVMGSSGEHLHVNGAIAKAYLGADTAAGLVYLYGLDPALREDVAVVHWKYWGIDQIDPDYGDHAKTKVYGRDGNDLPGTWMDYDGDGDDDELHYHVYPGQMVQLEITLENNGASLQRNVFVRFYFSDDSSIHDDDIALYGGVAPDLGRNDVYTTRYLVHVPMNLTIGRQHWIGVIVDTENFIDEQVEWNNATYVPVLVVDRPVVDPRTGPLQGPGFIKPFFP